MTKIQKLGALASLVLAPAAFVLAMVTAFGMLWSSVVVGHPVLWYVIWGTGPVNVLSGLVLAASAAFGLRSLGRQVMTTTDDDDATTEATTPAARE